MGKTNAAGGKKPGFLTYLLSFFLFISCWQLLALAARAPLILPGPFAVLSRLGSLCGTADFYRHIGATMGRVFIAFTISFALGNVLGLVCGQFRRIRELFSVLLTAVRSVPVVSFILIALFWLGSSSVPVVVAVVMALPVMLTAVATGFAAIPRELLDAASAYRLTAGQVFRRVTLPCLLPFVRSGSLSSFGMIWKVVAAGEVLSLPRRGAGQLLYTAQVHLESADLLAVTLAIVILSFLFERGLAVLLDWLAGRKRERQRLVPSRAVELQDTLDIPVEAGGAARAGQRKIGLSPRIELDGFSAVRSGKVLYKGFSIGFEAGSSTALIAPSGAGKTTLLCFVASLLRTDDGVFSGGVSFGERNATPHISFLFQDPCLFPACTVYENVLLPLLNLMARDEASRTALRFLTECGLSGKLSSFPDELSGGEKQRAALARAFAFPSQVMLLDEAFQSQDLAQKVSLLGLFQDLLAQSPRTVIFVSHDIREALSCCSRVVLLKGSPLRVGLDELLPAPEASFSDLYLAPGPERLSLERQIAGLLLDRHLP